MTNDVIIAIEGRVGRLSLNRPTALHALTLPMCQAMLAALQGWRDDSRVEAVLVDHAGGRGFCAGGDVRAIADAGSTLGRPFFDAEYRLNLALFDYPKPVIAVMDGVVMGGGAGLALPATIRVATERTLFAMPETLIGLIPDVGGGWYLPRLPGETGTWLGLTGARLGGGDCLALGVATHLVDSAAIDRLKASVIAAPDKAGDLLSSGSAAPPSTVERVRIDDLFKGDQVEAVIAALTAEGSNWSQQQVAAMRSRCPISLKATLRHLRLGRTTASFGEVLAREHQLCTRLVDRPDFREGVRAAVVDKDQKPVWRPATLETLDGREVDALFAPLPPAEAWRA